MGALQLARSIDIREVLREVLNDAAIIESLDTIAINAGSVRWKRLICKQNGAVAVVAIGEPQDFSNFRWVWISPDARRIWQFWNFLGDRRLVRVIRRRMLDAGARLVVGD